MVGILSFIPFVFAEHDQESIHYLAIIKPSCENCPELEQLVGFDTSNPQVSGSFNEKNGILIREDSQYGDKHWYWYYPEYKGQTIVFVDIPLSLNNAGVHVQKIKIHQEVKIYPQSSSSIFDEDGNLMAWHIEHRWHEPSCNEAVISSNNWVDLLMDTIRFMEHNCNEEFTNIETRVYEIIQEKPKHDIFRQYVHNKMVKLGEWCATQYPCPVYSWDVPEWMQMVKSWYESDDITHDTYDRFLSWTYNQKLITEIPPH